MGEIGLIAARSHFRVRLTTAFGLPQFHRPDGYFPDLSSNRSSLKWIPRFAHAQLTESRAARRNLAWAQGYWKHVFTMSVRVSTGKTLKYAAARQVPRVVARSAPFDMGVVAF
jgi:hypothetical protein